MQKNADARALVRRPLALTGAIACASFILDAVTKTYLFAKPDLMTGFSFFFNLVQFTDFKNRGISFNIPLPLAVTVLITLIVLFSVVFWLIKHRPARNISLLGAGLLIGGALGNLSDRLMLGYVRDWLLLWHRSAINLADISILLGILLLWNSRTSKKEQAES